MNKIILFAIITVAILSSATASDFRDLDGFFSKEEITAVRKRLSAIEAEYQFKLHIYLFSDRAQIPVKEFNGTDGKKRLYVYIDRTSRSTEVSHYNLSVINQRFFKNVFFQFMEVPMKEGKEEVTYLNNTLAAIEKELQVQVAESQRIYKEQPEGFDPVAKVILFLFLIVAVYFFVLLGLSASNGVNKYEVKEFYGFSRMPLWLSVLVGAAMLFGGGFMILQYIGEGSGWVLAAYLIMLFPILVFACWIIMAIKDYQLLPLYDTQEAQLTLGQQLWLVKPQISTEHLMEVTFYEQIIKKRIEFGVHAIKFPRRRDLIKYNVTHGVNYDSKEPLALDEAVFLRELVDGKEYLEPYLVRIYNTFGNFKVYRKDFVLKSLFLSGLLSKTGYPFNYFGLSDKGKEVQQQLFQSSEAQSDLILAGTEQPERIAEILPQLTPHVLLMDNFEERITDFYNQVVEVDLLEEAMSLPFGFLFHPNFSLRSFNLKLLQAYRREIYGEDPDGGGVAGVSI